MTIVDACDENTKTLRTLNAHEIKEIWDFHVRGCRDTLTKDDFDCIVKEAYNNIFASFNDSDSDFSSSGSSAGVLMRLWSHLIKK